MISGQQLTFVIRATVSTGQQDAQTAQKNAAAVDIVACSGEAIEESRGTGRMVAKVALPLVS